MRLPRLREQIAPLDDLSVLVQLTRLIRRERFTVVHMHCAKGGFLGRLAANLARTPVVVHTFHAFAAHPFMGAARRAVYRLLERLVRSMADRYVAVSPRVAPLRPSSCGSRRPGRSRWCHRRSSSIRSPTVRIDPFDVSSGSRRESPVVGWVGRIVRQKAPEDFVAMAGLVHRTHPGSTFVMIGDAAFESDQLERRTQEAAARLGIDIVFTGAAEPDHRVRGIGR